MTMLDLLPKTQKCRDNSTNELITEQDRFEYQWFTVAEMNNYYLEIETHESMQRDSFADEHSAMMH
jgi:hypothetical protein